MNEFDKIEGSIHNFEKYKVILQYNKAYFFTFEREFIKCFDLNGGYFSHWEFNKIFKQFLPELEKLEFNKKYTNKLEDILND